MDTITESTELPHFDEDQVVQELCQALELTRIRNVSVDLSALIQELQGRYPNQAPRVEVSPFRQGETAGALSVIDYLKTKLFAERN